MAAEDLNFNLFLQCSKYLFERRMYQTYCINIINEPEIICEPATF